MVAEDWRVRHRRAKATTSTESRFSCRKISSLQHSLVTSQNEAVVQPHGSAGDLWRERFVGAGTIEFDDPPLRLDVAAIYAATDLAA